MKRKQYYYEISHPSSWVTARLLQVSTHPTKVYCCTSITSKYVNGHLGNYTQRYLSSHIYVQKREMRDRDARRSGTVPSPAEPGLGASAEDGCSDPKGSKEWEWLGAFLALFI